MISRSITAMDAFRYPEPIEITVGDIAWFRLCRSVWIESMAGAPGVIPPGLSLEQMGDLCGLRRPADVADRLERTLCAFFIHGRFASGRYALAPPVPRSEAFAGAFEVSSFEVTANHLRLFQKSSWRKAPVMDSKRPYGTTDNLGDIARIFGIPVPPEPEEFPPDTEAQLRQLHYDVLFVVQAYLQHAELEPGRYVIPFDGWDLWIQPLCEPVPQAQVDTYVGSMQRLMRQDFPGDPGKVTPRLGATEILWSGRRPK
jgi:hypothetical protein